MPAAHHEVKGMADRDPVLHSIEVDRLARPTRAIQLAGAADLPDDDPAFAEAYVTLCGHSGIASADVLCLRDFGHYTQGDKSDRPHARVISSRS